MPNKDETRNKIRVTSKYEDKTETDNQWAAAQNLTNGVGFEEKTATDNKWVSTNKNMK